MKNQFKVIDLVYTEEEGNEVFSGSYEDCCEWISQQSDYFTYKVVINTQNLFA